MCMTKTKVSNVLNMGIDSQLKKGVDTRGADRRRAPVDPVDLPIPTRSPPPPPPRVRAVGLCAGLLVRIILLGT